ncbi:GNAT family N-acetyltransferase [Bradyrhizobium sp. CCBAU 051011]|jgi:ribosomal protein S18 acetylase RimI-like enzyme|uniref:GNAT family N-acetyltransferase n=1 Tax=Bradyrhizobium sp. CCBAU 051011 TaxID=858422 RepID=UPI001373FF1C|nr:GNAT family N-acetyltransferase [Bradyrhizobium sp. CCBAU 051011]QHO72348.1 GNAT family N-acetyltransferase [Bradyrhizobium sp. CCBAU 051011]
MTNAAHQAADHDNEDVVLVPFAKAHLEGALKLSQEMSWPYRIEDWEVAQQLGRGFVLQRAGVVIGTAGWWPYGETHASAGMIIVAKAAQGHGYGARLMDALLASAYPRTIVLNSTAEGFTLYQRRGFVPIGIIHQHQGIPGECHEAPQSCLVRAMAASDLETIARLDRQATGWERRRLLDRLVQSGDGYVLLRDGMPRGYAISRHFGRGHVIGPVVAESPTDARALIEAALAALGRAFVRIDTSASSQLGEWLEGIGLQQVGDATTMVLGTPPLSTGPARTFAIANQSFG